MNCAEELSEPMYDYFNALINFGDDEARHAVKSMTEVCRVFEPEVICTMLIETVHLVFDNLFLKATLTADPSPALENAARVFHHNEARKSHKFRHL